MNRCVVVPLPPTSIRNQGSTHRKILQILGDLAPPTGKSTKSQGPRPHPWIQQKSQGPGPDQTEITRTQAPPTRRVLHISGTQSPPTGKSQGARPHPPDETEIPRTQAPPTGWTRNPRDPGPSTGWNRNPRYPGSERSLVRLWVGTWENLSSPVRPRTTLDGGSV
jgi:hypothetical protein